MQSISPQAQYVLQFINQTNRSLFLTGKAGTGKTTLLREIIQTTHKNCAVVAPTGIAALNAGGVTIHSLFQLPFGGFIPDSKSAPQFSDGIKFESPATLSRNFRMSAQKKAVIQNIELLIIDEVSMLRADMMDAIDFTLQNIRRKKIPYGGVQILFIGDLLQLPPVIKEEEWRTLKSYYKGKFFFHSHAIQKNPPLYIELSKIFRQTDEQFISVLNNLRNNTITQNDLAILNQYVNPNFDLKANKGYITLTTHNNKADIINQQNLIDLTEKSHYYKAEIIGDFPDKIFPLDENLELKIGAQIMFIKNDPSFDKNYFNGKMGVIKSLSEKEILVYFADEKKTIEVEKYEWTNIKYIVNSNTKEIEEENLGTFTHYPIKLAWAITVHKSQGLTFDKAALDVSQVFVSGQAYVALSRLRSLNGLVLLSPLQMNGISNDFDVMEYANNKATEETLEFFLKSDTKLFILNHLKSGFNWNDVAQQWRNLKFSFSDSDRSEKTKHSKWANDNFEKSEALMVPANKFLTQLDKLFATENIDFIFVNDRILAAYNYFYEKIDNLIYQILYKIHEVQRKKQVKLFLDELLILEDLQIKALFKLMKSKKLIETVIEKKPINKENLNFSELKSYKANLLNKVLTDFKNNNLSLVEETEEVTFRSLKNNKESKKHTSQITYELWVEKKSIEEIAVIRKFSVGTIYGHFIKLIQDEAVSIKEILPKDKLLLLEIAFKDYNDESLNSLKEKHGETFSWDELKLFKASLK